MPPRNVLLLLCEGAELSEMAAFVDVLGWSTSDGAVPVTVTTASTNGSEVMCTFGMRVRADRRCADLDAADFDGLAIPGGFESFNYYADAYSPAAQNLIRQFVALGKPVAAVCVGALPLAKTGCLVGRRATTYHLMNGLRRKQLADLGAIVVDGMVVEDGPFITSTSPATAMEVAFRLLARVSGADNATAVRNLMGFGGAPGARDPLPSDGHA
jgi:4-methyl-5(b-hydroxyethyl)-thiazole monophosphate biosynthesis